jgi:uncharacterized protein YdaU (DUF1376 family)
MSKEYFSHDYNARSDPKLRKLLMREGIEGIGIYWCIIEMLYEQEGILPLSECEAIAFELHTECERIESVIHSDLFIIEDDSFYSQSVINRLEIRNGKSKSASNSANARWAKWRASHANALQTQSESNAIKVNKSKEKEKKIYSEQAHGLFSDLVILFDEKLRPDNDKKKNDWLNTIEKLLKNNSPEHIKQIVKRARMDVFWGKQFLSLTKLSTSDKNGVNYFIKFETQFNGSNQQYSQPDKKRLNDAWERPS